MGWSTKGKRAEVWVLMKCSLVPIPPEFLSVTHHTSHYLVLAVVLPQSSPKKRPTPGVPNMEHIWKYFQTCLKGSRHLAMCTNAVEWLKETIWTALVDDNDILVLFTLEYCPFFHKCYQVLLPCLLATGRSTLGCCHHRLRGLMFSEGMDDKWVKHSPDPLTPSPSKTHG